MGKASLLARIDSKVNALLDAFYRCLNRRGIVRNAKQRGWHQALSALNRDELVVLETGRIRSPQFVSTDGNSTYYLSNLDTVRKLISIDNDSENYTGFSTSEAYCRQYLRPRQLSKIAFINGDSREVIPKLPTGTVIDAVLLDSANDPTLIFDELRLVMPFLTRRPSVIIVDDVSGAGKKGEKVIPYLDSLHYEKNLIHASPCDCAFFVLS